MNPPLRLGAGLAAAAVALGPALVAAPAQASPAQAASAADWLADQLTNGVVHNEQYDFDDLGLTADIGIAFAALDVQPAALESIMTAFATDPTAYTTGEAFGDAGSQYAGATGKLATLVQQTGGSADAFGGHDLTAELEGVVVDAGDEAGRGVDASTYGDNSNTLGQAWVVRALAGADSDELDAATAYLVKQQCASGQLRINMFKDGTVARECGASGDVLSVDATALAVPALLAAADAGAPGASAAATKAIDWLAVNQADDGSFADAGVENSNSTGLAAAALAAGGRTAAATTSADWTLRLQTVEGTPGLGTEVGAIAYDPAALAKGKTDGIVVETRDQWIRATAQAVLGLPNGSATEVATVAPKASATNPRQGDTITVTTTGVDQFDRPAGDVSDEVELTSSVETDTIDGNRVTFNEASPHVITATHVSTGATSSITVEVTPLAVDDPDDGTDDGASGGTDDGAGTSGDGTSVADGSALPDTGGTLQTWHLLAAGALVVAGAALLLGARRRQVAGE